jgi:hypothetical protein
MKNPNKILRAYENISRCLKVYFALGDRKISRKNLENPKTFQWIVNMFSKLFAIENIIHN